jgi:hypothetical protein
MMPDQRDFFRMPSALIALPAAAHVEIHWALSLPRYFPGILARPLESRCRMPNPLNWLLLVFFLERSKAFLHHLGRLTQPGRWRPVKSQKARPGRWRTWSRTARSELAEEFGPVATLGPLRA